MDYSVENNDKDFKFEVGGCMRNWYPKLIWRKFYYQKS